MDRRGFTKLIVAAVLGVRVADEVLPAGPTLLGQPATEADAFSMSYYVNPHGGFLVPGDLAEQIEADLLLYGNAYTRSNASRVHPLIAIGRRHA